MQPHSAPSIARLALVVLSALTAGACAGRAVLSAPAAAPLTATIAVMEDIPTLPVSAIRYDDLVSPPARAPETALQEPEPSCDVVAAIGESFSDPALIAAPLWVGVGTHRYTEVRVGVMKTYRDQEYDIALRVLDPETCSTEIVTIRKTYGTRVMTMPSRAGGRVTQQQQRQPAALVKSPPGWNIEVVRRSNGIEWNNWATDFSVAAPSGRLVVGLKFPIVNEIRTRGTPRVTEVLYAPIGRDLLSMPDVRKKLVDAGMAYATGVAEQAFEALRAARVPSRAVPGAFVADVPQLDARDFVYRMAVEHMDQMEFTLDPLWTTDRIFAVMGANRERFATLTCSPAKACGPMQFTKGTYRFMDTQYPAAGLINDFTAGVRDPLNAMKAAILLDDHNLAELASVFGLSAMREERLTAYNTGVGRTIAVRRIAEKTDAEEWTDARGKRCSRANNYAECFLTETKGYVVKYRYLERPWHDERVVAIVP